MSERPYHHVNGASCRHATLHVKSMGLRVTMLCFLTLMSANASDVVRETATDVRIYGVRILVADMDAAVAFYSGALGFPVVSTDDHPNEVELRSEGLRLFLRKTSRAARYDYSGSVRTTFGFQANDLLATREKLRGRGVEFIEPEPFKVGVGIATTFKDPSGNVLYLLEQQVGDTTPFEEPRIYNVGFHLPDQAAARGLYCDVLGFVVRSERYLPAVPLGHADGTFAFMLHEKPGLAPRKSVYPDDAQIVPLFVATQLSKVAAMLKEAGAGFEVTEIRGEETLILYDAFGNVSEMTEHPRHPAN